MNRRSFIARTIAAAGALAAGKSVVAAATPSAIEQTPVDVSEWQTFLNAAHDSRMFASDADGIIYEINEDGSFERIPDTDPPRMCEIAL